VQYGGRPLQPTTLVVDDRNPLQAELAAAAATLRRGRFSFVMWVGDGDGARALAPLVRALPETRFVYLDASLETLGLEGTANATAVRFAEEESSELVGYLSGLVAPRGRPFVERADVVSVVGAAATPQAKRMVAGFTRGVRRALPNVEVLVDYSGERDDRTPCEELANAQIDRGSDVVFSVAGRCGTGALAVARFRGIWAAADDSIQLAAIARDGFPMLIGPYLVQLTKDYTAAAARALAAFELGELPAGKDIVLGLNDDYAVALNFGREVPDAAASRVVELCTDIRRQAAVARTEQQAATQ
jgi:basic membrane protein A and related proteins